jgi:hypothetical protein
MNLNCDIIFCQWRWTWPKFFAEDWQYCTEEILRVEKNEMVHSYDFILWEDETLVNHPSIDPHHCYLEGDNNNII